MPRIFGLGGNGAKIGITSGPASIAQRDFDDDFEFDDGPNVAVTGSLRSGSGYDPRTAILKPQNLVQGGVMAALIQQQGYAGGGAITQLQPGGAQGSSLGAPPSGVRPPQYGGANMADIAKGKQARAANMIKSEMSAAYKAEEQVRVFYKSSALRTKYTF